IRYSYRHIHVVPATSPAITANRFTPRHNDSWRWIAVTDKRWRNYRSYRIPHRRDRVRHREDQRIRRSWLKLRLRLSSTRKRPVCPLSKGGGNLQSHEG